MDDERLLIVTPVYNDWPSCSMLIGELGAALAAAGRTASIIAVDDCSTQPPPVDLPLPEAIRGLRIVRLHTNVGHQRAIAIGLMRAATEPGVARVAVMDSDGEDLPGELIRMIDEADAHPNAAIVARRAKRSEGLLFRLLYGVYLRLFFMLTGQRIRFGNFSVLPHDHVRRIVNNNNIWNNLAATIVQSRLPIRYVATSRGMRYAGRSTMNVVSLISHGLGAIAVFSDAVFIRVTIASTVVFVGSMLIASTALVLKLVTSMPIPGWATTVLGFAGLASIQAIITPIFIAFLLLSNRSVIHPLPSTIALTLIRDEHLVD